MRLQCLGESKASTVIVPIYACSFLFLISSFFCKQVKKGGGLSFNSTCQLTKVDEKMVQMILHEYKIFNAEVCQA